MNRRHHRSSLIPNDPAVLWYARRGARLVGHGLAVAAVVGVVLAVLVVGLVTLRPAYVAVSRSVDQVERAIIRDFREWVNPVPAAPVQAGASRSVPEFVGFVADQESSRFAERVTGAQLDGRGLFISTVYDSRYYGATSVQSGLRLCSLGGEFLALSGEPIVAVYVLTSDGSVLAQRSDVAERCAR